MTSPEKNETRDPTAPGFPFYNFESIPDPHLRSVLGNWQEFLSTGEFIFPMRPPQAISLVEDSVEIDKTTLYALYDFLRSNHVVEFIREGDPLKPKIYLDGNHVLLYAGFANTMSREGDKYTASLARMRQLLGNHPIGKHIHAPLTSGQKTERKITILEKAMETSGKEYRGELLRLKDILAEADHKDALKDILEGRLRSLGLMETHVRRARIQELADLEAELRAERELVAKERQLAKEKIKLAAERTRNIWLKNETEEVDEISKDQEDPTLWDSDKISKTFADILDGKSTNVPIDILQMIFFVDGKAHKQDPPDANGVLEDERVRRAFKTCIRYLDQYSSLTNLDELYQAVRKVTNSINKS